MMSRAAQTHLAGHMRPAGRVFETPGLELGAMKPYTTIPFDFILTVQRVLKIDLFEIGTNRHGVIVFNTLKKLLSVQFLQQLCWQGDSILMAIFCQFSDVADCQGLTIYTEQIVIPSATIQSK